MAKEKLKILGGESFVKIRKSVNKGEWDEMVKFLGFWEVNKETKFGSFIFLSETGTKKLICISRDFLEELLKEYENYK